MTADQYRAQELMLKLSKKPLKHVAEEEKMSQKKLVEFVLSNAHKPAKRK